MSHPARQAGFAALELVLISGLVLVIALAGWMAWENHQIANAPGSSPAPSQTASPSPSPGQTATGKFLLIKEWNVKVPLTSGITDATYTISPDGVVNIRTAKLNTLLNGVQGCTAGLGGVYIARSSEPPTGGKTNWGPVHIGSYYYSPASIIEPMCAVQLSPETSEQLQTINNELPAAVGKLTAN